MSILRLLSTLRAVSASSSPSRRAMVDDVRLALRVEGYGTVFMAPPDDPLWPAAISDRPRDDHLLRGELDVYIPPRGRRRCKAIRVRLQTLARLNMGPKRGWEEDVIFEGKCEVLCGTSEGLWLDEGVQRFEFTLILPSTLAAHDWHHNGKITHHLYAELEGLPEPFSPGLFRFRTSAAGGSISSNHGSITSGRVTPATSASRSRSPSPLPSPRWLSAEASPPMSPILLATAGLSITRQEPVLPQVPSYEESEAEARGMGKQVDDSWIRGSYETKRTLMVMHNPNPHGAPSDLDERQSGFAPGFGVYDLKIFSDVFTIGGFIHARLTLPDLSPKATIFNWRLLLAQTHTVQSPRDDEEAVEPISSTRLFPIIERGKRPPTNVGNPGLEHRAMWRGVEAGGTDSGSFFKIEGNGVMPKDDRGRPSTLPGIVTPIKVSHSLIYEVYFSLWGETDGGQPMKEPGPGGLRFMKVQRPIIVPSCTLIPPVLNLPQYDSSSAPASPCPKCLKPPGNQLCLTCPSTILPDRWRNDDEKPHPNLLAGSCPPLPDKGVSNLCLSFRHSGLSTTGRGDWDLCACGVGIENIEERMKRFILEGVEPNYRNEAMQREKEEAERGRPRRGSPERGGSA
ncbi:hypothetical protein JCM24511_02081 [Saitozyma sp. JCM 24511]|nr:hypothetical protein JCM24511_02081 [Saitozyma sp. JCM 24511]